MLSPRCSPAMVQPMATNNRAPFPPPSSVCKQQLSVETPPHAQARRRADRLLDKRDDRVRRSRELAARFDQLNGYLAIGDRVTGALKQLNDQLFQQLLSVVEE